MDKITPKQCREKLCLVWFAHLVILVTDVNKVIEDDLMVIDYPDEVSHPRIFRLLAAKNNTKIKEADLFNPLDNAVVHPWIVPTEGESVMTSYITLGHVDTITNPTVVLIKKELDGVITIRKIVSQGQPNVKALHDQPTKANLGASSSGVVGVGGRHADAATTHDDKHVDAQEK
ncbi:hypothetical protein FXO37_31096 [Capsicum annuum]|nr:hypothetical protein FXO37_31096 [Capsicum annuum]